jgi:hypothetical protein
VEYFDGKRKVILTMDEIIKSTNFELSEYFTEAQE